jgi:hypothetical protein
VAVAERPTGGRLDPIVEDVARAVRREGIGPDAAGKSRATLRISYEDDVRRVVQVYWTPFEASVPGRCVSLNLEVAQPRVYWAECYLSPEYRNWVFCFAERPDGEMQLSHHAEFPTPRGALEGFFDLATWYVLTPVDLTWNDVAYELGGGLEFPPHLDPAATTGVSNPAVQESLKKSTILWMRWHADGVEHTMPVWYLYDAKAGKVYVLSGERQQTLPGAEHIRECDVILRWKGRNSSVAELPARVRQIEQGPEWDEIAERIAEKRLNIPGLPEETARRWRDECVILELDLGG